MRGVDSLEKHRIARRLNSVRLLKFKHWGFHLDETPFDSVRVLC